jgi:hypothetical protein
MFEPNIMHIQHLSKACRNKFNSLTDPPFMAKTNLSFSGISQHFAYFGGFRLMPEALTKDPRIPSKKEKLTIFLQAITEET